MYGRILSFGEEQQYERDEGLRLAAESVRDGTRCVVRIKAEGKNKWGVEYGGVVKFDGRKLHLQTIRVRKSLQQEPTTVPLRFDKNDMLMSEEIRALPERPRTVPGNPLKSGTFPATPAVPSRPIGYVLGEEFAAKPITEDAPTAGQGKQPKKAA